MHVGAITFHLSLPPCGLLGSSNHTTLFILSYTKDLSLTLSLLTLMSLHMTQLYLSCNMCEVLHRTMWCPSTYGYGALKINNEFNEFEFIYTCSKWGRGLQVVPLATARCHLLTAIRTLSDNNCDDDRFISLSTPSPLSKLGSL